MRWLIVIVGVVAAMIVIAVATNYPVRRQLRALAGSRNSATAYSAFQSACTDIPQEALREIYDQIQNMVPITAFPVCPSDELLRTLAIDDGTLADYVDGNVSNEYRSIESAADLARAVWRTKAGQRTIAADV